MVSFFLICIHFFVLIVDERIVQELFTRYIRETADRYSVCGILRDASNALLACENGRIDLVLMDICTANNESGLKATAGIKRKYPQIKVIIVTAAPEVTFLRKAREAGADRIVAGSAVFEGDIRANTAALLEVMKEFS